MLVTSPGSHNEIRVTLKQNLTILIGHLFLPLSQVLQVVPQRWLNVTLKLNLTILIGHLFLSLSQVLQIVPQSRRNMAVLVDYHDIHIRVFDVVVNVSVKFR